MQMLGGHNFDYLKEIGVKERKQIEQFLLLPVQVNLLSLQYLPSTLIVHSENLKINFSEKLNFVLFGNKSPLEQFLPDGYKKYFKGPYSIIARGKKVLIYNRNVSPKHIVYKHHFDIRMSDNNFLIWLEKMTPHWDNSLIFTYKLMKFGGRIKVKKKNLNGIQFGFINVGFEHFDFMVLQSLVNNYGDI